MIQRSLNIVATRYQNGFVTVQYGNAPLDPRLDLVPWHPDDFDWGFLGDGPAQLALAILAAVLGDDAAAMAMADAYHRDFIATIRVSNWTLPASEVLAWVEGRPERARWIARN